MKPKKKKDETITQHKERVWKVFSLFIRTRDKGICFTCGYTGTVYAGHYIPKSLSENLRFNEYNVHAQCFRCNNILLGNSDTYAEKIEGRYGKEVLQELRAEKRKIKQWNHSELDELLEIYKEKLMKL